MFYEFAVTVPANTPASSPLRQTVTLVPGTLVGVSLQFPPGCVGLVHAQIWEANHQRWPSNPGGSISADGVVVAWQEDYPLVTEPYQFILLVWNQDDTFAHTVTFRLNLIEQRRLEERTGPLGLLRRMAEVLGVRS